MPALALVVRPLPAGRAAVRAIQQLLEQATAAGAEVVVFCPEPHQAPAAWQRSHRVLPLADLAHERRRGSVTAPAYVLDGGPGEAALERAAARVPGVAVDANAKVEVAAVRAAVA